MSEKEPLSEQMVSTEGATTTPWPEVIKRMNGGADQTCWLATVRPDGRPHLVPVGAIWLDGAMYFTTGQGTVKGANLETNHHCAISQSSPDFDIIVEGTTTQVKDTEKLQRVASVYAADGWPAFVHDGMLDAPFSAPTTGPAPYDVYEVTPTIAFALGTKEETVYNSTRYRF